LKKLRGLRYLPGGATKYVDTLIRILEFVDEKNPDINQLKQWFYENFHVKAERIGGYVRMLERQFGLIEKKNGRFMLTENGKNFAQTRDAQFLFKIMNDKINGFDDVFRLLSVKPCDFSEIDSALRARFGWKTKTQTYIRLGWLQSMGYVTKIGRAYSLTDSGRAAAGLVKAKIEELKPAEITKKTVAVPCHNEIRNMLYEIGKFEGWISETEYPIDSYRLDVAWKRIKAGNPSYVFEVQIGGNFFEALTKLKHTWDKWNSKPFLVTTEKYELQARQLLEGSFHEIQHITKIVNWRKVRYLYEAEKKLKTLKNEVGVA